MSNPCKRLVLVGDVATIEWLHPEVRNGYWLDIVRGVVGGVAMMKTISMVSGAWPFFGHALSFSWNPVQFLQRAKLLHGDMFRFRLLGKTVYALMSSKGNEAVFRAPDDVLDFRDAYRFTVLIFGTPILWSKRSNVLRVNSAHKARLIF